MTNRAEEMREEVLRKIAAANLSGWHGKKCRDCGNECHTRIRVCEECGYEFYQKKSLRNK